MKKRPLSPHLQIYRWRWVMLSSIVHRFTAIILTVGMVYLSVKLFVFAFLSPRIFNEFINFNGYIFFIILKFLFFWALIYHLVNGWRHMVWDTGSLFSLRVSSLLSVLMFVIPTIVCGYYFF